MSDKTKAETRSFEISTQIRPAGEWIEGLNPRGARVVEFRLKVKRKRSPVENLKLWLSPSEHFDDQTSPKKKERSKVKRSAALELFLQPRTPKGRFKVQFHLRGKAEGKQLTEEGEVWLNVRNPFEPLSPEERKSERWVPVREENFDRFKEELQKDYSRPVFVYGPPGIGKTTFIELCRWHLMSSRQRRGSSPPVIIIAQPEKDIVMADIPLTEFAWTIDQAVYKGVLEYLELLSRQFTKSNPAIKWVLRADDKRKRMPHPKDLKMPTYMDPQSLLQLNEQMHSEVEQASYRVNRYAKRLRTS